jgi:hypothetical protein
MILLRHKLNNSILVVAALVILSGCFVALTGSIVGETTVQYDEFTDLVIASSLSVDPLSGHSHDGSQARFPMYVTAVAQRLARIIDPNLELLETLLISRWISIFMTVLAVWGTYLLGSHIFDARSGLLAAALFTFSPYVLHFGRDALTQGDAFTPVTVLFTLVTFEQFHTKRTTFRLVCFTFCLALAISAKFLLVILIPALITYQLLLAVSRCYRDPDPLMSSDERTEVRFTDWSFIFLAVGTGISSLFALLIAYQRIGLTPEASNLMNQTARLLWAITLSGIFLCCLTAFRNSRPWPNRFEKTSNYWLLGRAWLAILPLTLALVLALFPDHIFNHRVVTSLVNRFLTMDGNSSLFSATLDSVRLYLGLILFKLGLPLGIATCLAFLWAVKRSAENRGVLLLVMILLFFGLLLAIFPLQQPLWLMSIYPLIMLLLSVMIVRGFSVLKGKKLRLAWAGFVFVAVTWLAIGLVQVFPTFGYYGYELIGDSWLGNESRGYRRVVVVTNDGSTEALEWLLQNAPVGSIVISYLDDVHIIDHLASIEPLDFDLKHAAQASDKNIPMVELSEANFVIVRVPDDVGFRAPVNDPTFVREFGFEPVYQVWRGRGVYRMAVIQIFQRKS